MRITIQHLGIVATLLVALSSAPAVVGQEPPPAALLTSARADLPDPAAGKEWFVRSRPARPNPEILAALGRGTALDLTVRLFDDVSVRPIFRHFDPLGAGEYTWTGGLRDHQLSSFVLSVYQGVLVAEFRSVATGTYQIRHGPGGIHFVRQVDPSKMGRCGLGQIPPLVAGDADTEAQAPEDGAPQVGEELRAWRPSTIDVLVVYTAAASQSEGGGDAMVALINAAIADANDRFANSQIAHRLRLVRHDEVAYSESGDPQTDLGCLADDNCIDDVHQLREDVGGDLVSLLVEDFADASTTSGVGYRPPTAADFVLSLGFSVVVADQAISGSLAHELGHNLGCHHHPNDLNPTPAHQDTVVYPYAFGHRFGFLGSLRTTMAYSPGERISHFSNPDVTYGAQELATGRDDRDNARVIDNTGPTVAAYRLAVLPYVVWVDVGYAGNEHGTWAQPWNTVQEGVDHLPAGGTLFFKPGSSPWTGSITNRSMTLKASGGSMVIGQ